MIETYDNFLTEKECRDFIRQINDKKDKIPFTNNGIFENDKYIDYGLTDEFYSRLIKLDANKDFLRPNNLIMTGKYKPHQTFSLHTDTGLYFDLEKGEHSKYTLLIYLNDNYDGGETSFYTENFVHVTDIQPKIGTALLFNLDQWHKGNTVLNGDKYWIGCEIIGKMEHKT